MENNDKNFEAVMGNQLIKDEGNKVSLVNEKNISDKVLNQISILKDQQGLVLPANYNVANALKSAYLVLSQGDILKKCSQISIANSLLDMCVQGLNVMKKQCYFIDYGGSCTMMRSYFGDVTACKNSGLIVGEPVANVIYEGDEVNVSYDMDGKMKIEHKTDWKNFGKNIVGAYAIITLPNGEKRYDIMDMSRIKKSWGMSKNQSNNKLQQNYTDDACKRTVIRHLVKMIFNTSNDENPVVESYCKTTNDEYDNSIESATNNVKLDQEKKMASIKVDADGVVDAPETPNNEELNFKI